MLYIYMIAYVFCAHNLMYTVSKNDTDIAHYNFNAYQRILVIFQRRCWENILANGDLLLA